MAGFLSLPSLGAFFFSAWLTMVFWGMVAPDVGLRTISYTRAMLVTIGLWLAVAPLAGVLAGTRLWWGMGRPRLRGRALEPVGADMLDIVAVFGGASRTISSKDFRGGKVTAIFGGVDLDLRDAAVQTPPAVVDVTAVMGGVEIKVPPDWKVQIDASAVFGGTSEERKRSEAAPSGGPPQLVVTGTIAFGGVSIKG
ncbi:MAG: hypothetical protein HY683_06640 [Chloroflexi bacterium]|nr:hypothetical protein [Chloroflexota bacterium]